MRIIRSDLNGNLDRTIVHGSDLCVVVDNTTRVALIKLLEQQSSISMRLHAGLDAREVELILQFLSLVR